MSWFVSLIIFVLVLIGIYAVSAGFRGIIKSLGKLVWKLIKKIATKLGVPVFLVVIGILAFGSALFLLIFLIGYEFNLNWLLRPLLFFNFFMMLITIMVTKWRNLALVFLFICTILLFSEADIIIFKANLFWFGLYTLFCLAWLSFGIYTGKTTIAAGIFLITVMTIATIFAGYTHLEKERWVAWRDNYLAKRGIQVANTNSVTATLNNNWKFGLIKMRPEYDLLTTDSTGNFVTPKFDVKPGAKILVCTKDPSIPQAVEDAFLNLPVRRIKSSDFRIKEECWILAENIQILTDLSTNGPKVIKTINIDLGPNEEMEIPEIEVGRYIMVVNPSNFTLSGIWGSWNYEFRPGQKGYNFTNYKPGDKFIMKNLNYARISGVTAYIMEGEKKI